MVQLGPPPTGQGTAGPAAVFNKFGKGQSLFLGVGLFQALARKLFWIRYWVPAVMRLLVPQPVAELRADSLPEYVHGTFFWKNEQRSLLVQILNAIELATGGELGSAPIVSISINGRKNRNQVSQSALAH